MNSAPTLSAYSKAVAAFLSDGAKRLFIGGQWIASRQGSTFDTVDPGSGDVLTHVFSSDEQDVDAAVTAARTAFEKSGWRTMPANERGVYLHRLADLVDDHRTILAELESLDVGKPTGQAQWDIENFSATVRYYADLALHTSSREAIPVSRHEARTVRHPAGVCGFIFPWNFPFLLLGWGIAPALAAGNTVVVKPAEETPLTTLYFGMLVREAGIPDGVVNIVPGLGPVAGAALANHRGLARMSFTGSPEVGRLVAESCGRNLVPAKLELGGKGAAVVFDDVDVADSVDKLCSAVTLNAGQVCCTATRWFIHNKIYDDFVQRAIDRMGRIRVGYWNDPETGMGPVVSEKQRRRVLGYIDKATGEGAQALIGGTPASVSGRERGFYVEPALLAGSPDNIAAREEIFGPVPIIMRFDDEESVIATVNRSPYGLANSVWSSDLERASRVAEQLVAGNGWINAHNVFVHGVPYGGVNLSGLGGGVLGPSTFLDYHRSQSVVRPL